MYTQVPLGRSMAKGALDEAIIYFATVEDATVAKAEMTGARLNGSGIEIVLVEFHPLELVTEDEIAAISKAKVEAAAKAEAEAEKRVKIEAEMRVKMEAEREAEREAKRKAEIEAEKKANMKAEEKVIADVAKRLKAELDAEERIRVRYKRKIESQLLDSESAQGREKRVRDGKSPAAIVPTGDLSSAIKKPQIPQDPEKRATGDRTPPAASPATYHSSSTVEVEDEQGQTTPVRRRLPNYGPRATASSAGGQSSIAAELPAWGGSGPVVHQPPIRRYTSPMKFKADDDEEGEGIVWTGNMELEDDGNGNIRFIYS